jgi:hypothetical protein
MTEGFLLYVLHNNYDLNSIVGQVIVVSFVMHVSHPMLCRWDRGRWTFVTQVGQQLAFKQCDC